MTAESVAWAAARKDVLSGLFAVLALLAYERFVRRGWSWYPAVFVCLANDQDRALPSLADSCARQQSVEHPTGFEGPLVELVCDLRFVLFADLFRRRRGLGDEFHPTFDTFGYLLDVLAGTLEAIHR